MTVDESGYIRAEVERELATKRLICHLAPPTMSPYILDQAVQLGLFTELGWHVIAYTAQKEPLSIEILVARPGVSAQVLEVYLTTQTGWINTGDRVYTDSDGVTLIIETALPGVWRGTNDWRINALRTVLSGNVEIRPLAGEVEDDGSARLDCGACV